MYNGIHVQYLAAEMVAGQSSFLSAHPAALEPYTIVLVYIYTIIQLYMYNGVDVYCDTCTTLYNYNDLTV